MHRLRGEATERGSQINEQSFGRREQGLVVESAFQAALHRPAHRRNPARHPGAAARSAKPPGGGSKHRSEVAEFAKQPRRGQRGLGGSERAKEVVQDGSVPISASRLRWRYTATISSISCG